MEVYLDNSATTRVTQRVRERVSQVLYEDYGNPSSMHRIGVRAENHIKEAAKIIAANLKVEAKELVFTSGGTESNNLALIGAASAYKRRGKHIITTGIEHPSVHQPLKYLEEQGYLIEYAPVDEFGLLRKEELYGMLREDTILVSIIYVNNEIGAVQQIKEIAQELKQRKKDIILHVDAVQAFGKYRIYPKRENIDLLSVSGHKIHGPKGSGVLYVNEKVRIHPTMFGGGHQRGLRSGTENVPAIAGFGQAVEEIYMDFEQKQEQMYRLKQKLIQEMAALEEVSINGLSKETAPHIISVNFKGVRSEVFLHALEDRGIYLSAGSACSTHHVQQSATLTAIGLPKALMESTLRISLSHETTEQEIDYTIEQIKELLPLLRKYTRKK